MGQSPDDRATMTVDLPQVSESTRDLKNLTRDLSGISIKCNAQLYASAVGFLCLLQRDLATLHGFNKYVFLEYGNPDSNLEIQTMWKLSSR